MPISTSRDSTVRMILGRHRHRPTFLMLFSHPLPTSDAPIRHVIPCLDAQQPLALTPPACWLFTRLNPSTVLCLEHPRSMSTSAPPSCDARRSHLFVELCVAHPTSLIDLPRLFITTAIKTAPTVSHPPFFDIRLRQFAVTTLRAALSQTSRIPTG